MVRTRRSHRRGHRFESCQDHKTQAILLENKAVMPKITVCCQSPNVPPPNRGGSFCLYLLGVANTMDRTQWFIVEVGSSSVSTPPINEPSLLVFVFRFERRSHQDLPLCLQRTKLQYLPDAHIGITNDGVRILLTSVESLDVWTTCSPNRRH